MPSSWGCFRWYFRCMHYFALLEEIAHVACPKAQGECIYGRLEGQSLGMPTPPRALGHPHVGQGQLQTSIYISDTSDSSLMASMQRTVCTTTS